MFPYVTAGIDMFPRLIRYDEENNILFGRFRSNCFRVIFSLSCLLIIMIWLPLCMIGFSGHASYWGDAPSQALPIILVMFCGIFDYFTMGSLTQLSSLVSSSAATYLVIGTNMSGAVLLPVSWFLGLHKNFDQKASHLSPYLPDSNGGSGTSSFDEKLSIACYMRLPSDTVDSLSSPCCSPCSASQCSAHSSTSAL